jgi:hypothetical protein
MPVILDLLYREYCRARLAEMRKQLLISPEGREVPEPTADAKHAAGLPETAGLLTAPLPDVPNDKA